MTAAQREKLISQVSENEQVNTDLSIIAQELNKFCEKGDDKNEGDISLDSRELYPI